MSDKFLDFQASSFILFLLILELVLAVLLTINNVSTFTELVGEV